MQTRQHQTHCATTYTGTPGSWSAQMADQLICMRVALKVPPISEIHSLTWQHATMCLPPGGTPRA